MLDTLREQDASLGKSPKLADLYFGTLVVLAQTGNPERLAQAAHSLRELMEKGSRHWGVAGVTLNLANKVRDLAKAWARAREENREMKSSAHRCQDFKKQCDRFFSWYSENPSDLRQEYSQLLSRHDLSGLPLPEDIATWRAERWSAVNKFFQQVAHHKACDVDRFDDRVAELEELLLDMLLPPTSADQERIRQIIKRAEGHD